jgi:transposase InsO family protein
VRPRYQAYRPQTNGKAERFFRTLLDERVYTSPSPQTAIAPDALEQFVCGYSAEGPHLGPRGLTSRLRLALQPSGVTNVLKDHP